MSGPQSKKTGCCWASSFSRGNRAENIVKVPKQQSKVLAGWALQKVFL